MRVIALVKLYADVLFSVPLACVLLRCCCALALLCFACNSPDAQTGFNLIICYYALGDRDKMKKGFMQLLGVPELQEDDEEEEEEDADKEDGKQRLHG